MNQNDSDYAEYFARQEEEFKASPKAKTEQEIMAEYSFIEFRRVYGN
jgi:hypothetical protein